MQWIYIISIKSNLNFEKASLKGIYGDVSRGKVFEKNGTWEMLSERLCMSLGMRTVCISGSFSFVSRPAV